MTSPSEPRPVQQVPLRASLLGGVVAAVAALGLFLELHALWILPIWFILAPGLAIAGAAGLALGWAYHETSDRMPSSRLLRVFLVLAVLALTLVPAQLLALSRSPVPVEVLANLPPDEALRSLIEVSVSAGVAGALLSLVARVQLRAVGPCALAASLYAVGIGHNVPLIALPWALAKMWSIMLLVTVVASTVLVVVASGRGTTSRRSWGT